MDIKEIEKLKKMNNKEIQKYLSDELNKAREPISFGYIRVSTTKQANDGNSLESQEKAVKEAGATEIYQDTYTGTSTDRPNFTVLMNGKQYKTDNQVLRKQIIFFLPSP